VQDTPGRGPSEAASLGAEPATIPHAALLHTFPRLKGRRANTYQQVILVGWNSMVSLGAKASHFGGFLRADRTPLFILVNAKHRGIWRR